MDTFTKTLVPNYLIFIFGLIISLLNHIEYIRLTFIEHLNKEAPIVDF